MEERGSIDEDEFVGEHERLGELLQLYTNYLNVLLDLVKVMLSGIGSKHASVRQVSIGTITPKLTGPMQVPIVDL